MNKCTDSGTLTHMKREQELLISNLYKAKIPVVEIARQTNLFPGTIYRVLKRNQIEKHPPVLRGEGSPAWKGGKVKFPDGYIRCLLRKDHPLFCMTNVRDYVPEHRLVMAEYLERPLNSLEQVHHINGIRDDNRIENLQLVMGAHGSGIVMECQDCGSQNIGATGQVQRLS